MGKVQPKQKSIDKSKMRITRVNKNGRQMYAIEKLVFKFMFISLWQTVTDYLITPASPMEYKTIEKAHKRMQSLL